MPIDRRSTLKLAAAGVAGSLLPALPVQAARKFAGRALVFASWGGVYQEGQRLAYCVPFERKTGARVIKDGPVSTARLRVMLDSGNIAWDLVAATQPILMTLQRRLEKVNTSIVDVSRVESVFRSERGIGCDVGSQLLAYSTEAFAGRRAPQEWADLFDLKRYPGRRMLPDDPRFTFEMALLADGVPMDRLYPLDVERAYRKLSTIADKIIFYKSNSQAQQLIVDGVVTCGMMFHSRAFACVKGGAKIGVSWSGNLRDFTPLLVPQGGKNIELAWALANEFLVAENQAVLANAQSIAPTNFGALKFIKPEILPWLPTSPQNLRRGVAINAQYWAANLATINKRWQFWKLM